MQANTCNSSIDTESSLGKIIFHYSSFRDVETDTTHYCLNTYWLPCGSFQISANLNWCLEFTHFTCAYTVFKIEKNIKLGWTARESQQWFRPRLRREFSPKIRCDSSILVTGFPQNGLFLPTLSLTRLLMLNLYRSTQKISTAPSPNLIW